MPYGRVLVDRFKDSVTNIIIDLFLETITAHLYTNMAKHISKRQLIGRKKGKDLTRILPKMLPLHDGLLIDAF